MGFAATSQFDSNTKGAAVTLSGSNLVATVTSGTGSVMTNNKISGLVYWEMTLGDTLSGSSAIGFANWNHVNTSLIGTTSNSVGYNKDGTVKMNNVTITTIMTYTALDRIGVAVDYVRQLVWFRKNNGDWNNDVIANQNPVGAVGGISFANIPASTLSIAWGGSATSSVTVTYASGSWVDTAPTGYLSNDTLTAAGEAPSLTTNYGRGGILYSWTFTTQGGPAFYDFDFLKFPVYTTIGEYNMSNPNGSVSGIVTENGTPVGGKLVVVYDPKTMRELNRTYCDGAGAYELDCAGRPEVFVVAFDPNDYQMLGFDRVTPA